MKTIEYYLPGEDMYGIGCAFATQIYREKLHMTVHRLPDVLFVAHEDGIPLACIGLNRKVHNVIFTEDAEIQEALEKIPDSQSLGEQYLWASNGYSLGATILVSVLASYASKNSIRNVIFTGTMIAMRSMRAIGARPVLVGKVKETVLHDHDKKNCEKWFSVYRGTHAYVQPVKEMELLNERMLHLHQNEVTLGPKLMRVFYKQ